MRYPINQCDIYYVHLCSNKCDLGARLQPVDQQIHCEKKKKKKTSEVFT